MINTYKLIPLTLAFMVCGDKLNATEASQADASNTPAAFLEGFYEELVPVANELGTAQWVYSTYITSDSASLVSKASDRYQKFLSESVGKAKTFIGSEMDPITQRSLNLLLLSTAMPSPSDPKKREELSKIATEMEGIYGSGKYCPENGKCLELEELEKIIAESRDYSELTQAWAGWREVSVPLRPMYERFAELTKEGAKEFGYDDLGVMWKSAYDMPVKEFEQEVESLWTQVKPLYEELHCYTRSKLNEHYGDENVPLDQAIPAHLLGNMWSQTWSNIYDLVEPYPGQASMDITKALVEQKYDAVKMTETAEDFFVSLGLPELPESFWNNSLLTKPRDRDVVCHASAWDLKNGEDPRIKQCIEPNEEQLSTVHHELGHIYYYLMYKDQPPLFKSGAHDGFHEAIGDTIVLSMTPEYMKIKGLADSVGQSEKAKINEQMRMALEKIAFLPFGKLIDQWRWQVFSGETSPDHYNKDWWELRETYQGIRAPISRSESDFDPGAKYHIPGNTPYTRYFLSFIIQFQFHKALCDAAGFDGPLSDCSIYNNKVAGKRLGDVLKMGASKPWQEAMEALTGQAKMDGSALIEYFKPLQAWLKKQNSDARCGW